MVQDDAVLLVAQHVLTQHCRIVRVHGRIDRVILMKVNALSSTVLFTRRELSHLVDEGVLHTVCDRLSE